MQGRIARAGQATDEPVWTVIQCRDEGFDKVSIIMRESRLSEAQAILELQNREGGAEHRDSCPDRDVGEGNGTRTDREVIEID